MKSHEKNQQKNDLKLAKDYRKLGIEPFPLPLGKKIPARGQRVRPIQDLSTVKWEESNIAGLLGSYSSNAFALDFDNKSQYKKLLRNSAEIAYLAGHCPVVETGRGVHIIAKAQRPIQQSRSCQLSLDIKGQGGYVVLPNSLHHSGKIYRFLDGMERFNSIPNVTDDIIFKLNEFGIPIHFYRDFESGQAEIEAEFQVLSDNVLFGLPVYTTHAILEGETLHYSSRSEAECALVAQCIHRGLSNAEILTLFELYSGPKSKYKSKRESIRRRYLALTIHNIQTRKYTDSLQRQEFLYLADFWAARGTCLSTVLSALCSFSYVAGKTYLSCSIRDIALKAGIDTKTVRYATASAEEKGFITRVEKGFGWNASLWHINTLAMRKHAGESEKTLPKVNNIKESEKSSNLHKYTGHNLFRSFKGIGKNGMAILFLLSGQNIDDTQATLKTNNNSNCQKSPYLHSVCESGGAIDDTQATLKTNNNSNCQKSPYLHSFSIPEIIHALDIKWRTVYRKLALLSKLGLVVSAIVQQDGAVRSTRMYRLAEEQLSIEMLNKAAKKLGLQFIGERQAEHFAEERLDHQQRLAKLEHAPAKMKEREPTAHTKAVRELFDQF